jgi:predicted Zn-dependent protease
VYDWGSKGYQPFFAMTFFEPIPPVRFRSLPNPGRLCAGFMLAILSCLPATPAAAQVNLPVLGDSVSGTISTQQEYEFGRELLRQIRRETPMLNDPLIMEYIVSLTFKLAVNSELKDNRLEFVLIDSEILNAFAAPGGIVGVNAGLFLHADNEGQFASVLSHELAHISQRHYARSVQQQQRNALPSVAGLLASLIIASTVGGDAGQAALMTTQAVGQENQLRYSRSNEQEADRIGIRTLYNAGFDPYDMAGMFEQMMRMKSFSRRLPEFLSTHPLDENRIADSKNRANTLPDVSYIQNIEFLLMKQRVTMHYANDRDAEIQSLRRALPQLNGIDADAATYGIALGQIENGQFAEATQTLEPLLQKDPTRITYVMLQADIARKARQYERALSILRDNLGINPNNHPLTMAYALTLEESGRHGEAADVLERQSLVRPNDPELWFQLAEIQGQAGNISKVHQARGEYFITVGDFTRARNQFNLALDLERDRLIRAKIQQRLDYIRDLQNRYYR